MRKVTPAGYRALTAVRTATEGKNARRKRLEVKRGHNGRKLHWKKSGGGGGSSGGRESRSMVLPPQHHQPQRPRVSQSEYQRHHRQRQLRQRLQLLLFRVTSEHTSGDYIGGNEGLHGKVLVHGKHCRQASTPLEHAKRISVGLKPP